MLMTVFWAMLALIIYTYVLFPLLLLARALLLPRPVSTGSSEPLVSIIIAAHNEQDCIADKIENLLALDYPREQLELIIASDGSTDGTEKIVRQYASRGVRLLALPRGGKAQALNAAVAASRGDVLVFSDANSMFERRALRELVSPLADPQVGGVAGDQRYSKPTSAGDASTGERGYWKLDRWMKRAESRAGNVISATGAIYAIRRQHFQSVPEGVTDDFVTSTRVIAHGKRLVFSAEAIAWEPAAKRQSIEFGRKTRVISRGLRGVWMMRRLLNPLRFGFYSLQLFSHKVLRRLMVFPLIILFLCSLFLWGKGAAFQYLLFSELAFLGLAMLGAIWCCAAARQPKVLALPMYFCMVNLAALVAVWRNVTGRSIVLWQPQRAGENSVVIR